MRERRLGRCFARPRVVTSSLVAVALTAASIGASPALAAIRYAAPTPAGSMDCSSPANACGIEAAIGSAAGGDEVLLASGSYGSPGTPLSSEITSGAAHLDVHAEDMASGPPRAQIFSSAAYGIALTGPDSTISGIEIIDSASSSGSALLLDGEGSLGERLIARAGEHEAAACMLARTATLRDSVCQDAGSGSAVRVSGTFDGPNEVTVRNVTAIAPNGVGIAAESAAPAGRQTKIAAINAIARGGTADILAFQATQPATVGTSHSNYETTHTVGGGTITDDGTSQTKGDQTSAQLFVNPGAGDFHEQPGAQTIHAGITEGTNGELDVEGHPRTTPTYLCAGSGNGGPMLTDIGAYQIQPVPPPCPPPPHHPRVEILSKRVPVTLRNGHPWARILIRCEPEAGAPCEGSVGFLAIPNRKGAGRAAHYGYWRRFVLQAGAKRRIRVRLFDEVGHRLEGVRRLRARALVKLEHGETIEKIVVLRLASQRSTKSRR
jgi:hypothetical protein